MTDSLGLRLCQNPVKELQSLRGEHVRLVLIASLMLVGVEHACRAQQEPAPRGTQLYQPTGVRVHDPWLVNINGTVHLFHLLDVWHATSGDCLQWEPHRAILPDSLFTPAERKYHSEQEVWTGCAVQHEGKIFLFWTGNKGVNQRFCNRTCVSISSDGGKTFTHHPDNPVIKPDPRWYDTENDPAPEYPYHGKTHRWSGGVDGKMALMDWRDIAIVKDPKTGLFHGYITARLRGSKNDKESACIARVSSKDLVHWDVHPPTFHPGTWGLHEVPDVFQLGGKWYLTVMATNPKEGVFHGDDPLLRWGHGVGEANTPEGPFRLVKNNCVMAGVDQGRGYYSMRTVEFKGERLAFACGDKLSLAVKLVPREGGGLQDVWWADNAKLFGKKRGLALRGVPGQPTIEAPPGDDDSFMITARLELGTASAAGITFRKADGKQPNTLFLDSTKGCFEWAGGDTLGARRIAARTWPIKPGGKHTIRVINIEQHLVVYLDDRYVMNGRGLKLATDGLALTSVGGNATLHDVQYWGPRKGPHELRR
jgi:hypothetical protein